MTFGLCVTLLKFETHYYREPPAPAIGGSKSKLRIFPLIILSVNNMPPFIFKPIYVNKSENSENQ
jgi:hypothetical protein